MYVCMYIRTYVRMYAFMHVCIYVGMYISLSTGQKASSMRFPIAVLSAHLFTSERQVSPCYNTETENKGRWLEVAI